MKSTGEVMGFDKNFGMAFAKAKLLQQILFQQLVWHSFHLKMLIKMKV